MTSPTTPDLEWISDQVREILVYFKSFSAVHYLYRSYIPIKLKQSWKHLLSDDFINSIFAQAEINQDSPDSEIFKRIGYGLLQWRPLVLHFKESFRFARKYGATAKRVMKRPIKQSKYLRQIEKDFEKVRILYRTVGEPIQKRPEQVFHPGLNGHSPSINDLTEQFLKENTPQYKNLVQMELAEFKQAKLIAPGFRLEQWKSVLPYFEEYLGLTVPPEKSFKSYSPKGIQQSWMFPIINPQEINIEILIASKSGPHMMSSGLHELGHGIHYQNMPVQVPFIDRFVGDNFLTETIAYVFASLATRPEFLKDVWDLPDSTVQSMIRSSLRLAKYLAQKNALDLKFRIELFTKDWDIIEAQGIYHEYLQKYMGLSSVAVNNFHIAFRPFLPGDYLLANIYSQRIISELQKVGGIYWWRSRRAGTWMQDHWFHFGLANPLPYPEWIS